MLDVLRYFLLVADHGAFTHAARQAHVTQPALTGSIRRLEEQVGSRLFDRGRHGATLTAAGQALLPHARAAVVAVDEGLRAAQAIERMEAGEIRIGGGQTACTYLLPPLFAQFRKKFPKVTLRLRELPEDLAVAAFEAGELDLVITSDKRGELFRHEPVVLVAAKGADVDALPYITFPRGSGVRALLDRHFPEASIAMELGSISTVKGAVRAGLGVALISRTAVATDLELGRLVLVKDARTPLPRPLYVLSRPGDRLLPAARELRRLLLADAPRAPRVKRPS